MLIGFNHDTCCFQVVTHPSIERVKCYLLDKNRCFQHGIVTYNRQYFEYFLTRIEVQQSSCLLGIEEILCSRVLQCHDYYVTLCYHPGGHPPKCWVGPMLLNGREPVFSAWNGHGRYFEYFLTCVYWSKQSGNLLGEIILCRTIPQLLWPCVTVHTTS